MGKEKEAEKDIMDAKLPATIRSGVEAIAKAMGVAAVELWSIFVRQYVVKGLTEFFTAVVLISAGVVLVSKIHYWSLLAFGAALPFCYGTILLLGNPKYYAIQDITRKIKELK
jgi:hypothetical protein